MIPPDEDDSGVLVVRRVIPVPRERVFAAWLDPVGMARWLCAGKVTRATAELDPRVGGAFRIVMHHDDTDYRHDGVYLAIEPPSLLSFTWVSAATELGPSIVTIEFLERDRGAATEVVLTHRGLPPSQVDGHRRGWSDIVGKLGEVLARASESPGPPGAP